MEAGSGSCRQITGCQFQALTHQGVVLIVPASLAMIIINDIFSEGGLGILVAPEIPESLRVGNNGSFHVA